MRKNSSSYPVEIVADAFGESPALAKVLNEGARVFIVADQNIVHRTPSLGTQIGRYFQDHGLRLAANPLVVSGGEKVKADGFRTAFSVLASVLDAKIGQGDYVLALGGGTILDLAGYAASQVRGGIGLVRLPTTPASMFEAAFADYAAVDSTSVKDALRVPSVPSAVVIDPSFAATVLDGVWRSGMGEAVRLALASDASLLKKLEGLAETYAGRDPESLKELLDFVLATRKKKGPTSLALWSAQRLETMSGYKVPHGYAVSIGVLFELAAAKVRGCLDADEVARVVEILKKGGATETLAHSQYLLQQTDSFLCGLDAWGLTTDEGVAMIKGLGKSELVEAPDREVYREAAKVAGSEILKTL